MCVRYDSTVLTLKCKFVGNLPRAAAATDAPEHVELSIAQAANRRVSARTDGRRVIWPSSRLAMRSLT